MPSFDSIVVGEDWISEHYFTTDSTKESFQSEVLKLRKQWDEQVKEGNESVLKRFLGERGTFQIDLAELLEEPGKASAVYHKVRESLGYKGTTADFMAERAGTTLQVPNAWKSHNGDVLFLESSPVESVEDLLDSAKAKMMAAASINDKEEELSTPKLVSELYRADEPPQFIVVFGGRWLLLTERERWAEGRYLAVDLLLACERNDTKRGGEIDRVLAIFGRESLLPDAGESIWWNQILENSIKHTIGVSKDLREGIRLSIEIIANDVLSRCDAAGLPVEEINGKFLARQSLRYLYRILFLLYAEASPEMGVLPVGVGEYDKGYGLDRLRELALNVPQSERARSGTHIYQSLGTLFRLVDQGHEPSPDPATDLNRLDPASAPAEGNQGLHFGSLKADLFDPRTTADIDLLGLSNAALQKVLEHLLLSKEIKGKDRGFISYAELGVNQLGAVYEGLMSYTGFIAETDLHEVAKDGDSSKGSWVVPVVRSESIERKHFVMTKSELTGEPEPVLHEKGTFVFRLAGRERQQSASYYTPEVLTRFVVSQALEELLGKKLDDTPADEILKLTICEPALGSGAFAIEAVRQLADAYLKLKQAELGRTIPAENYGVELQKVKAQIALHQVYGVDLNSTAVELAEVSLWLDTMVAGLQAPWFGLHLRRGNSLIGARRATYSRASINDKSWLTGVPEDAPLLGLAESMAEQNDDPNVVGRIHHFLLPAVGWGAAAEAKEVKDLAGEAQKDLRAWRNRIRAKPSKTQVDRLTNLARRVETLWQFTLRRLEVAESEARRDIDYFGKNSDPKSAKPPVSRHEIEQKLNDPNGAYQRLRRVMDAWNALWFWPLTENATSGTLPPTMEEWLTGLEAIMGVPVVESSHRKYGFNPMQGNAFSVSTWTELNVAEANELLLSGVKPVDLALHQNPWLQVCEHISADQGFFHWELDFATAFARGGFDLQVGNPPWVRPRSDEAALLAEGDPWWQLEEKPTQAQLKEQRTATLSLAGMESFFIEAASVPPIVATFLSASTEFPMLQGLQPDLYRSFMVRTWRSSRRQGIVALIHPETHFSDAAGNRLRRATYTRLRRHWHFVNALKLFEIGDTKKYGVHVYGDESPSARFMTSSYLYHPDTVTRSLKHDGSGPLPGLKDEEDHWDLRPHAGRITWVDHDVLASWALLTDAPGTPALEARAMTPVNNSSANVLRTMARADRMRSYEFEFARGWDESIDRKGGVFEVGSATPASLNDVILQGPHFSYGNPFAKFPKVVVKSTNDWLESDLEQIHEDYRPRTNYQRLLPFDTFQRKYPAWGPDSVPSNRFYRVAWRRMIATNSARSFHAALIPPGPTHVHTVHTTGTSRPLSARKLLTAAGTLSSLPLDFLVRSVGAGDLWYGDMERLPAVPDGHPLTENLLLRAARLNCLSGAYADLWAEVYSPVWEFDSWVEGNFSGATPLGAVEDAWTPASPLRRGHERSRASAELDSLVAVMLGITANELCSIYRTQFPVFMRNEAAALYDAAGRRVPSDINRLFRLRGGVMTDGERTATNSAGDVYAYEFPFGGFDREAYMRRAHSHFTKLTEDAN